MKQSEPIQIRLEDYQAPDYTIKTVHLTFWLDKKETQVESTLELERVNPKASGVMLNGEELLFDSLEINGKAATEADYQFEGENLVLKNLGERATLKIRNRISPEKNKALDGLYVSGTILCTQNEPEGFRRITYFLDRPDVMAIYTTTIIADKNEFPVLLSNGNLIEHGEMDDGKRFCIWNDPFAKPSYLYALVAGDLGLVQDRFTTKSGREIDLRIYCDKGNEDKCGHAMTSLQKSMAWDEERFGLEYDLDIYMIVAVDSFNMGAMENKGLNIFNSAYVLAKPETATDDNFHGIESVIGHEYFHNWTGNRITCRDWFQLTLKEGLTVYRDQEFSADLNSRAVERVSMVEGLRGRQFIEDAGPTAHPIKPKTYMEINNFYSATVYEKGAEVIRMIATMLGREGFRRGMDKYFELFDGQAVTTEDFIHAMSVANQNYNFEQFKLWYDQAGTPELKVHFEQNLDKRTVTLKIDQTCPPTPGQLEKKPFHMPLLLGLVNTAGDDVPLKLSAGSGEQPDLARGLLHLKKKQHEFVFEGISEVVVPSLNRDFSTPVQLKSNLSQAQLIHLAKHDRNEFVRYEMLQEIYHVELEKMRADAGAVPGQEVYAVLENLFADTKLDPKMKAKLLALPPESALHQRQSPIDIEGTVGAHERFCFWMANNFKESLKALYLAHHERGAFSLDGLSVGRRTLKNLALSYLAYLAKEDREVSSFIERQWEEATNMTDQLRALQLLHHHDLETAEAALTRFYQQWKGESLVMQKWLGLQATHPGEQTFERLERLEKDPVYDETVPNYVRALWRSFASNARLFHHQSGRGYELLASRIERVDGFNPQLAAGLAGAFKQKPKMNGKAQELMSGTLKKLAAREGISKNLYEVVSKILA